MPPFAAGFRLRSEGLGFAVNNEPRKMFAVHSGMMGQIVPLVKDNVSRDSFSPRWHNRSMSTWLDEAQFNDELCARVQRLRIEREWTQQQMAAAIGLPHERYKKYETRSPMPAYLLPRFAQMVDRSVTYLVTGKDDNFVRKPRNLIRATGTDG
ncbi:hypothetical protein GCM10011393_07480 [Sphingopyxis bauzanensis]|nr:hypothetical protein GCM10011393_07480 [Sphingopyxis bauzanensis]